MTAPPLRVALAAASVGGLIGSLARYGLTDAFEAGLGFPWAVFAINVAGSALLAALPLLQLVRQRPWVGVLLGTGVLGGFTTMSAASEQTVFLLDHDRVGTALWYAGGTLVAAVVAVRIVSRFTAEPARAALESAGTDQ